MGGSGAAGVGLGGWGHPGRLTLRSSAPPLPLTAPGVGPHPQPARPGVGSRGESRVRPAPPRPGATVIVTSAANEARSLSDIKRGVKFSKRCSTSSRHRQKSLSSPAASGPAGGEENFAYTHRFVQKSTHSNSSSIRLVFGGVTDKGVRKSYEFESSESNGPPQGVFFLCM